MTNFMNKNVGRRLSLLSNMASAAEMQLKASESLHGQFATQIERDAYAENADEAARMRGRFDDYLLKYLAVGGQYADEGDPYKLRAALVGHAAPLDAALEEGGLPHNGSQETIRQRHAFYQALLDRNPDGHDLYTERHADQFVELKKAFGDLDRKNLLIFNEMRNVQPDGLKDVYYRPLGPKKASPLVLYGPRYFETALEDSLAEYEIIKDIEDILKTKADPLAWLQTQRDAPRHSDLDNPVTSEASLRDWIGVQFNAPEVSNILPFKLPTRADMNAATGADQQSQPSQSVSASFDKWATSGPVKGDFEDTAQSSATGTKRTADEAGLEEQHDHRSRGRGNDRFPF